jgi:hypothetical protein
MNKKLLVLLSFFSFIIAIAAVVTHSNPTFLKVPEANAIYIEGFGGSTSTCGGSRICVRASNSGTRWRTYVIYTRKSVIPNQTYTKYLWSGENWDLGFSVSSNDTIKWLTACVDPEIPASNYLDVSCRSYRANDSGGCSGTTCGKMYGACGGPNSYPSAGSRGATSSYARSLGDVWYLNTDCPIPNRNPGRDGQSGENMFRCAYEGYVSSVDYVGCRNTSNYRYCGASNNNWYTNNNDSRCPVSCSCGNWSNGACGGGSCGAGERLQTRDCNPNGCSSETRCVSDSSCNTVSPPVAPNVSADANCNNTNPRISLDWAAATRATSYDVDYKRSTASSWTIGANNTTNTSYNITGILENTNYDWRVRSVNSGGNSAWDTGTTRSPTCSVPPPSCPSTITASSSCNSSNNALIDIDWSAVSGASSYDVRWKPSSSTSWNGPYNTTSSDYRISASSISNNTNYDYQIRAINSGGNSGWCPSTARTIRSNACTVTPTTPPNTRDLIIQSFNFPGGSEGSRVDPTVVIRNQGNTDITADFDVRVQAQQNGNGHNLTRRVTATVEAGTNEDVSSLFTSMLLGTAGNKTALATVDYNTEISESNEGNNTATDAYTITTGLSNINVNAFNDPTGNCTGTTRVSGSRVSLDGANSQSVAATNPGYTYSNVANGSHTLRLTPPTNYSLSSCDTNPKTRALPPDATANFWVQQAPPTCTSLTTNRNEVTPGQNATLTVNGCPANVNYTWFTDLGNFSGQSNNTVTWNSPNPYFTDTYAYPTVQVCFNSGGACQNLALSNGHSGSNPAGQGIHIAPTFSVSGNVFVDVDGNQRMQSDSAYSGAVTIRVCQGGSCNNNNFSNGTYNITGLTSGNYSIRYTNVPSGYSLTYPLNGPPPSFNISVGTPCSENSLDASCSNGSISGLNFGITNISSWIQAEGSDIRAFSGAFNNQIPPAPNCGGVTDTYTNRNNTTTNTPGLVFSSGSQDHDSGQASSRNWQVTGAGYDCNNSKTTYAYIKNIVRNNGITPRTLPGCTTSGNDVNCNTSSWGSLANGVYEINVPNGTANINGSGYTFPSGRDFVILVNGQLKINEQILVPVGSTAIFASSGDLTVASGVGSAATSRTPNLEGWYTTQGRLILENTNSCPTPSTRLNVSGAIVACGGFTNQRNLCGENANCPSFYIKERVDFILNAPEFLMPVRRVWQEVAP